MPCWCSWFREQQIHWEIEGRLQGPSSCHCATSPSALTKCQTFVNPLEGSTSIMKPLAHGWHQAALTLPALLLWWMKQRLSQDRGRYQRKQRLIFGIEMVSYSRRVWGAAWLCTQGFKQYIKQRGYTPGGFQSKTIITSNSKRKWKKRITNSTLNAVGC